MTTTLTVDEAKAMPGAFTAYRRTDGELIMGEYSWVTDYDCGDMDGHGGWDEPDEIEEVVMVPIRVRVYQCHEQTKDDDEET